MFQYYQYYFIRCVRIIQRLRLVTAKWKCGESRKETVGGCLDWVVEGVETGHRKMFDAVSGVDQVFIVILIFSFGADWFCTLDGFRVFVVWLRKHLYP